MAERFDVVIVGAGVIGLSVAHHLSRLGQRRIVVVERARHPATGSTARANGGIRAQFSTPANISMSLASMTILDDLAEEIGEPPLYRKAGYLFVTASEERLAGLTRSVELQRSMGVAVDVLGPRQVRTLAPFIAADDLVGGTFGPRDGFIDPGGLANFFLSSARAGGVEVRFETPVVGIDGHGDSGFDVRVDGGGLEAAIVVDAAGPWSAEVAAMVGVDLPVRPVRRHILVSGPCPSLPREIPMIIDADSGVLIRREGSRVVIAYSNPDEPAGFNLDFDPAFAERVAEPVQHRFPEVAAAGIDFRRSWVGLYEETPDHHAVIGEAPGVPGFFVVSGFSGHGVMHAPAAGSCVAELIVAGHSDTVDVGPLSPERFARGELVHETMSL